MKDKYWLSKEKTNELRWFAKGYCTYLEALTSIQGFLTDEEKMNKLSAEDKEKYIRKHEVFEKIFRDKLDTIKKAAQMAALESGTDKMYYEYFIFAAATGHGYEYLKKNYKLLPYSKYEFYKRYHRFWWYLNDLLLNNEIKRVESIIKKPEDKVYYLYIDMHKELGNV